jgi:predicted extracellular nuclease
MKSKLLKLTAAALMVFTMQVKAQSPATLGASIVNEGFETWSGASPNVPAHWEIAPANTIPAANVAQVVTTSTAVAVQSGIYSCKLTNSVASYSTGCFASQPVAVTAGMGYQISYFARGKGTINVEVTDGSVATSTVNYATTNGQTVSGKAWHHYFQTVTAPTTTNNAQFCLRVKSTSTYTAAGGISITGIDVDSFVVRPYTPVASASLYALQYTVAASGTNNSPFFGQSVLKTGGIVTNRILGSTGPSGYYVQTTGANAWAAALVFDQTNAPIVNVGDSVTFGCSVDEYFNMTELVSVTNFSVVSSGHSIPSLALNTQTLASEMYESMLVNVQNATVNTYSANYGQGTMTDVVSGVPCTFDFKAGFYAPNGTSTAGSTGNPGYTPLAPYPSATPFCVTGNINYEFSAYNIVPRDSADIKTNCTVLGIEKHNSLNANVYPNPMANELNIQLPFAAAKVSVSIIDVMGREMIAPVTTSGTNVNVNNVNLAAGTYFVKITADGKTQIIKVIKQ